MGQLTRLALVFLVAASSCATPVQSRPAVETLTKLVNIEARYLRCETEYASQFGDRDGTWFEYTDCAFAPLAVSECAAPVEAIQNAAMFLRRYYLGGNQGAARDALGKFLRECGRPEHARLPDAHAAPGQCRATHSFLLMPIMLESEIGASERYALVPPPGYSQQHCGHGYNNLDHRGRVCRQILLSKLNDNITSVPAGDVETEVCTVFGFDVRSGPERQANLNVSPPTP